MKKLSIAFTLLSLFFFVSGWLLLPSAPNIERTLYLCGIKITGTRNLSLGGLFLALAAWCFWEHQNAQKKRKQAPLADTPRAAS